MGSDGRTLRFGVLGPLAAWRGAEPLRLGGERQRALLALLLLRAGEFVPTPELLELVVAGGRADGSANAVHAAVSRLRRVLGPSQDLLLTHTGGYTLEVAGDQLDAAVFERAVGEGQRLFAAGQAAEAARRLRDGLGLWRGPPLADLGPLDAMAPHVRHLEELHTMAIMDRFDCELALGRHAEIVPELERLVAEQPLRERPHAQLMLALYRCGRQADALAVYRQASRALREGLGIDPGRALQELERDVLRHDSRLDHPGPGAADPAAGTCPFKGLASFESDDAAYFCGRDELVRELVARAAESSLVGLLGASGMGKSSLLRAGLLAALRAGALPGSRAWTVVLMRPGERPRQALRRSLDGAGLGGELVRGGRPGRVVIAIDQLEELFTECAQEGERAGFLAELARAIEDPERRVLVVCALRADFYGRLGAYRPFADRLSQSHVLVGPMAREELRQAIEGPATRAGLALDPDLVEELIAEVAHEPGGLPLLSTTLLELWRGRRGARIALEDYAATGGVRGAVARLAESVYTRLPGPEQRMVRTLLVRLAGEQDGTLVRRRVPIEQLAGIPGAAAVLGHLTDARLLTAGEGDVELAHEALLREWPRYRDWLDEDRVERQLHSHLAAAATDWEAGGRDSGDLYRGARLAGALDWTATHGDELGPLERRFLLASRAEADRQARQQASQNRRLRGLLLGTSVLLALAVVAGALALNSQRAASRNARLAAAAARAALGRQLGAEAVSQPRLDVAMLLAREATRLDRSPESAGTLLATLLRSPDVIGAFGLPTASSPELALSPDGRTLAVTDSDAGTLTLYDAATRARLGAPLGDEVGNIPPAFSPDGRLIAYADGAFLNLRDTRSLVRIARFALDPGFDGQAAGRPAAPSILISPDGMSVYFGYWLLGASGAPAGAVLDGWSLSDPDHPRTVRIGPGPLLALRLAAGGRRLVAVTGTAVSEYTAPFLRRVHTAPLAAATAPASAAAVSPDGRALAVGSTDGTVALLSPVSGRPLARPGRSDGPVSTLAFAPDGRTLVSLGSGSQALVWDARTGALRGALTGPVGQVQDAAVSPGATTLYTAALDGVMLAWDLSGRRSLERTSTLGVPAACCGAGFPHAPALALSPDGGRFAVSLGPSTVSVFSLPDFSKLATFTIAPAGDPVTALAFAPDGFELAVGGHLGVVQVWSLTGTPHLERTYAGLRPLTGLPEAIQSLAFSPDGALLAASDDSEMPTAKAGPVLSLGALALWRVDSGELVGPVEDLGTGDGPNGSDAVAFSRTGHRLAASLLQGGVLILDATSGQRERMLADPGQDIVSLAFGTGDTLAGGTVAGTVELWHAATGARAGAPFVAAESPITSLALDPGGERLATAAAQDGAVKLWLTASEQQQGPNLHTAAGATPAIAFEPGGRGLLALDDRGRAFTWPTAVDVWQRRACQVAGRNLTPSEWARYVAALPFAAVCP
jgi:WD40 repeat protein/DNA-binding SARP family transcriptional activator